MQYPEAKRMVAYGEFRTGFAKDQTDTRFVFYGLRQGTLLRPLAPENDLHMNGGHGTTRPANHPIFPCRFIVERFLNRRWTMADLDAADNFMGTHLAGFAPFPWPRRVGEDFVLLPVFVACPLLSLSHISSLDR